ncbi:hypothetical protein QTO34_009991 [Cnephaeus nilssonii]|uniref:Uncharacterized protein n=1 Tax=Cnephaeus nilssonii TaxID=3371016 RepID=A0AA40HEP5_CNENI|nr:hypothetical protein QTO34_009991 [Eptesicus nilssonii]
MNIREFIREKSLLNAVNVGNLLLREVAFIFIREFIREKSLINIVDVENLFKVAMLFNIIREFTLEKAIMLFHKSWHACSPLHIVLFVPLEGSPAGVFSIKPVSWFFVPLSHLSKQAPDITSNEVTRGP